MDYALKPAEEGGRRDSLASAGRALAPLLASEKKNIAITLACVIASSASNLLSPVLIARVIDHSIGRSDFVDLLRYAGVLAIVYIIALATSYLQAVRMAMVGRNVLFELRNRLFSQLSRLPIAFFAQNRAGDVISRINSDTVKVNQFFSQTLMQMFGSLFLVTGTGIVLLVLNWRLGLVALLPFFCILVATFPIAPWIKRTNLTSLESLGALSGDFSESLANFKVMLAFNRVDYFREKFAAANERNYRAAVRAGVSTGLLTPLYTLAGSAALILVLCLGVWLISKGQLTVGLLIGYLLYVTSFYNPLRHLATVWSSLQLALAALDRVSEILKLESDLVDLPSTPTVPTGPLLAFDRVSFSYPNGKAVLEDVSFRLDRGRTYALVGPTGGGKTTTAMLMARLYDPVAGMVSLDGRDIRSVSAAERAQRIGFILQEPFLFNGTVRDNIVYGSDQLSEMSEDNLGEHLAARGLGEFVNRFSDGLATPITGGGASLSLGQKQLVAFLRAVVREPEMLILDEATANIDTVTEQLLERVLAKLPPSTTRIVIAHRLNTIQNADDIFFVDGGRVIEAGSFDHAMEMLLSNSPE